MDRKLNDLKFEMGFIRVNQKTGKFLRPLPWKGGRNSAYQLYVQPSLDGVVGNNCKRISKLESDGLCNSARLDILADQVFEKQDPLLTEIEWRG